MLPLYRDQTAVAEALGGLTSIKAPLDMDEEVSGGRGDGVGDCGGRGERFGLMLRGREDGEGDRERDGERGRERGEREGDR